MIQALHSKEIDGVLLDHYAASYYQGRDKLKSLIMVTKFELRRDVGLLFSKDRQELAGCLNFHRSNIWRLAQTITSTYKVSSWLYYVPRTLEFYWFMCMVWMVYRSVIYLYSRTHQLSHFLFLRSFFSSYLPACLTSVLSSVPHFLQYVNESATTNLVSRSFVSSWSFIPHFKLYKTSQLSSVIFSVDVSSWINRRPVRSSTCLRILITLSSSYCTYPLEYWAVCFWLE